MINAFGAGVPDWKEFNSMLGMANTYAVCFERGIIETDGDGHLSKDYGRYDKIRLKLNPGAVYTEY